jgi:hypothetical protein
MESQPLPLLRRAEPCNAWALRRGLSYRGASIPRRSLWPIAAVASPSGPVSRCEETPAAASESARVQPFKCSQQVMPATRKVPLLPPNRRGSSLSKLAAGNARNEEFRSAPLPSSPKP